LCKHFLYLGLPDEQPFSIFCGDLIDVNWTKIAKKDYAKSFINVFMGAYCLSCRVSNIFDPEHRIEGVYKFVG
jgi:hypothetical protein